MVNSVKFEKNISGYSVKLPVRVLIIEYFVSMWFSYIRLATNYIYRMISVLNKVETAAVANCSAWESSHTLTFTAALAIHTL